MGNHFVSQILADLPLPTHYIMHFLIRSRELLRLHQIREALCPNLLSKMLACGNYFEFWIWPSRDSGFSIIFQICLTSRALLKASKSLNLKLPLDLVFFKRDHFLQWILDSLFIWPRQNLDIVEIIYLQVLLERRNIFIVYIGMT